MQGSKHLTRNSKDLHVRTVNLWRFGFFFWGGGVSQSNSAKLKPYPPGASTVTEQAGTFHKLLQAACLANPVSISSRKKVQIFQNESPPPNLNSGVKGSSE